MGILAWIVFGLLAGVLARIYPGKRGMEPAPESVCCAFTFGRGLCPVLAPQQVQGEPPK